MFRLFAVPPSHFSRPLHGSCTLAARKSFTPCSNVMHRSRDVGHQNGPFSALHAPSISVGNLAEHDMINRDVNKCTYLYRQLPPSALWQHRKTVQIWGNVGDSGSFR